MIMDKSPVVKIEVLTRKLHFGIGVNRGDLHYARLAHDGQAIIEKKPFIKLKPHEFRLYIAEQEYDKLLGH